ncbi:MAG: hypothetical protein CL678_15710 [Bdellovibrionaceae bacterium]|nr:hypothetical protein [Pseudobdellovibrionaceae bacterium]|tara:strand:+ start:3100 stop:4083 length:984 start_codon:yes stop_codon:yes gene_type:complete
MTGCNSCRALNFAFADFNVAGQRDEVKWWRRALNAIDPRRLFTQKPKTKSVKLTNDQIVLVEKRGDIKPADKYDVKPFTQTDVKIIQTEMERIGELDSLRRKPGKTDKYKMVAITGHDKSIEGNKFAAAALYQLMAQGTRFNMPVTDYVQVPIEYNLDAGKILLNGAPLKSSKREKFYTDKASKSTYIILTVSTPFITAEQIEKFKKQFRQAVENLRIQPPQLSPKINQRIAKCDAEISTLVEQRGALTANDETTQTQRAMYQGHINKLREKKARLENVRASLTKIINFTTEASTFSKQTQQKTMQALNQAIANIKAYLRRTTSTDK